MRIGIDARFLTHPQRGGFKTYTENLVRYLSLIDPVNTYVLYLDRLPDQAILPDNDNFSYQVVTYPLPALGMPIREQISLRRRIAHDHLDILHFPCNTAPLKPPGKFIVTLHDTIQLIEPQHFDYAEGLSAVKRWAISAYSRWIILRTAQSANRVITVSDYERTQIVKHVGVLPQRVCVTHLSTNQIFVPAMGETKEEWRAKADREWGIRGPFILGVGYEPRKNMPLLIEAFSKLDSAYSDLGLVIVAAEERSRAFFRQLIVEQNVDARVTILGAVSPDDLAVLYNLAQVFVFPSERESFGLPPLEASACGTPVVAANSSSIPEVMGDAGLMVDVNSLDSGALVAAIESTLGNSALWEELRRKGIERARQFSWEHCAQKTLEIYRDVFSE